MVNNISNIYSTISDGQTHIAADAKYIGTVDSYNNCFTKFFASLFGLSINVNFDGKIRSLNKQSYENLLLNLTQQDKITNIGQYTLFRGVAENVRLPANNLKMRDVISSTDSNTLYTKLARAIFMGNTSRALLMIGKGAQLDKEYFDRGSKSPTFNRDNDGLFSESTYQFTVFKAAPIVQAVRKANVAVVNFLKEAGANGCVGKEYEFRRVIISVDRRLELTYEPHYTHHTQRIRNPHGHGHSHIRHPEVHYHPELRERTTVNTSDIRTNEFNYKLDKDLKLVSV